MKMIMKVILFLVIMLITVFAIISVGGIYLYNNQTKEDTSQIANPASTFCENNDGTLEIRSINDGEYGVCVFEDNSECEEWKLYYGECQKGEYIVNKNLICTMEYAPVCGANGVTYSNSCFAGNIEIIKEGPC